MSPRVPRWSALLDNVMIAVSEKPASSGAAIVANDTNPIPYPTGTVRRQSLGSRGTEELPVPPGDLEPDLALLIANQGDPSRRRGVSRLRQVVRMMAVTRPIPHVYLVGLTRLDALQHLWLGVLVRRFPPLGRSARYPLDDRYDRYLDDRYDRHGELVALRLLGPRSRRSHRLNSGHFGPRGHRRSPNPRRRSMCPFAPQVITKRISMAATLLQV